MIQRIQSLYLFFVLVGLVLMALFPIANCTFDVNGLAMSAQLNLIGNNAPSETVISQNGLVNTVYLPITLAVMAILTMVTLFLYKKRIMQIRLIATIVLINMVYILLFFLATDSFAGKLEEMLHATSVHTTYTIGTFIPLATLILLVLAQRAIKGDERLIRSSERLR